MSNLVTHAPGWNLDVPAGTLVVRADVHMNQRPGAGGFAAILEAADWKESILIRGGHPDTTTDQMIADLVRELSHEIRGNRAVVITRSKPIGQAMSNVFKPYRMIRLLGNSPLAVADATRHAAVMAERAQGTRKEQRDRLMTARYESSEHYSENQDTATVHNAIQALLLAINDADLSKPSVVHAAQELLDAAEGAQRAKLREALGSLTANDIRKPTKEI
jgi:hypothetical protein